jgi:hypothetical protein
MVRNILYLAVAAVVLAGCAGVHRQKTEHTTAGAPRVKKPVQVWRHIVLFKFKEGTTPEQIRKFERAFRALPRKIDEIHDIEWGAYASRSVHKKIAAMVGQDIYNMFVKSCTHCFIVTFLREADRDIYTSHPAVKEFDAMLSPYIDKVVDGYISIQNSSQSQMK